MATTAPSCTPLINWIEGSSTSASKIGKSPVEGLKKMNSTPAALSCCTNSAPPVPCTSRIADAGAAAESDCAIAFTATELMPSADRPVMSLRREIPLSRYCLIRSFIEASSQGGCCGVYPLDQTASVAPSRRLQKPQRPAGDAQIALAAMFTVSASSAALKMNDMTLWPKTVRRIGLQLTVTSDTCAHMPITNEKYMKSQ